MAVAVDGDWLVADSEDEGAFCQLPPNDCGAPATTSSDVVGNSIPPDTSAIRMDVFTANQPRTPPRGRQSPSTLASGSLFTPPPGVTDLTIGNSTSVPSTSDALSAIAQKLPRPRPRVVMKKAVTSYPKSDTASTPFSLVSDLSIPATRRTNDSIQPATDVSISFLDAIDDAYSSFDIAERAKMRSRKSQTAKKTVHPPVQMNEVIELTSDEDELALKPTKRRKKQTDLAKPRVQTKPRPKPTFRVKPAAVLPSGSPHSQTVRDSPAPPAHCASSSQLPTSTLPTIPPSTPPQPRELTPLSSPPITTRKRKRIQPLFAEGNDETDIIGDNPIHVSPSSTIPPLFFAPSSSSAATDSRIEIPPAEPFGGRGKKKQVLSGKKGTKRKTQNKGKKSKNKEMSSAVDEMVENSARVTEEPPSTATHPNSSSAKECPSPVVRGSTATKTTSGKQIVTKKGRARMIDSCEEDGSVLPSKSNTTHVPHANEGEDQRSEENLPPDDLNPPKGDPPPKHISVPSGRDSVIPKLTPMSELIRRVNSQPSSPFPNVSRVYSPFLKSSRTMLSKIAPLHPNRRTPPLPPPRPPPPKKSKKQLEMEEQIDEELAETVDGWSCRTDDERKALRKARIDAELGYE